MEKMDMKFIAHVGVELTMIGGLAFYFYKKTSNLEKRIEELENQNRYLLQILSQDQPRNQKPKEQQIKLNQNRNQRKPVSYDNEEFNDEEFNDDELDQMLEEELGEKFNENCEGGICPLPK